MKYSLFLSLGLLSCSIGISGQQPAPTSATPAASSTLTQDQVTAQAIAQAISQSSGKAARQTAPPSGAAMTPEAPAAQDLDPNYVLGSDDAITVHVWKEPTISGPLTVRPDGRISLPLVGDLPAAGMTPMALAASIADSLKRFINDPSVTVTVTAANSKRIFFIGEVARSGPVSMTREMTMLQAISAAGGLSPYANQKKIYILRGEKGKQVKIPFDYKKALKEGNQQGVVLAPGDTIVVP